MASTTLTYGPRTVTAICARHGYTDTIPDPAKTDGSTIANPVTRQQFCDAYFKAHAKQETQQYEALQAQAAAVAALTDPNIT